LLSLPTVNLLRFSVWCNANGASSGRLVVRYRKRHPLYAGMPVPSLFNCQYSDLHMTCCLPDSCCTVIQQSLLMRYILLRWKKAELVRIIYSRYVPFRLEQQKHIIPFSVESNIKLYGLHSIQNFLNYCISTVRQECITNFSSFIIYLSHTVIKFFELTPVSTTL
jgi:hypothetical protein